MKKETKVIDMKEEKEIKKDKVNTEVIEPKKVKEKVNKKSFIEKMDEFMDKYYSLTVKILISLIVIIALFKFIIYLNSPTFVANKYFKAVSKNNIDDIYNLLNVDESSLVNKETLKEKINKLNVDAYKFESIVQNNEEAIVTYKYEYKNQVYRASVLLRKSMQNKYLIFNNWKVISSKLATNITIKAPINSKVLIDNKEIKEFKTESTDNYDIYTIEEMIQGKYNISIELDNGLKVEEEKNITSNSTYTVGSINLEDNIKTDLQNKVTNYLTTLYNNAIQNKNYNETGLDKLKDEYQYLKNIIQNKGYTLNNITFNDVTVVDATYDKNLIVTFRANCNYSATYESNNYSNSGTTTIKASFSVKDGKYTLENIDSYPINFRLN